MQQSTALVGRQQRGEQLRRRARSVLCAWAFAAVGCAELLDIPSDPRLVDGHVAVATEAAPSTTEPANVVAAPEKGASTPGPTTSETAMAGLPLSGPGSSTPGSSTPGNSPPPAADGDMPDAGPSTPDAPTPPDAGAAPCAVSQSLGPSGDCYVVLTAPVSWAEARQSCLAIGVGWDLASVRSEQTTQFLARLLTSEAWLGATDAETEGMWIWIDDRQPFWLGNGATGSAAGGAYVNWNGTEPDGGNSDCARIVPALESTWADLECSALRGAVCAGPSL